MKHISLQIRSKILLTISVIIISFSACSKKEIISPITIVEKITVEQDVIYTSLSGVRSFTFSVYPAEAELIYDLDDEHCQIRLVSPDAYCGVSENYRLQSVKPVDQEKGVYKATLVDAGKSMPYSESVFLDIIYDDSSKSVRSEPFRVMRSGDKIYSMSITKEFNGKSVIETMELEKTEDGFSISSALISSPELILTFETNSADVRVDGVQQVSGQTLNDFSKPLVYKVSDGSGKHKEYTVSIVHSGLPVLFIETPDQATIPSKHSDWLSGTKLTLYNSDWTIDFEGMAGIRGRGNSTWGYPKKPYAIKLDSKAEILGMPKHKRWILLANWLDRTLLRNYTAFRISEMTDLAYTPRGQFVEVYLNGKHNGCYFLCEHIKVDKNRVDVDELEDNLTDSGYIMELDSYYDEVNKFRSTYYNLPYMFKDPDEVNPAQFAYIKNYVNNLEASLEDDKRFAAREYADYIDIDSCIDFWFVQELTGNEELQHPKSTYMYKNTGGKLIMGPVWDFDWKTFTPANKFRNIKYLYYERMFEDPVFKARAKERWNMFKDEFRTIPKIIDSEADRIRSSESMNHILWPVTSNVNNDISLSFEEAVEKMKKSYTDQLNWMDNTINSW